MSIHFGVDKVSSGVAAPAGAPKGGEGLRPNEVTFPAARRWTVDKVSYVNTVSQGPERIPCPSELTQAFDAAHKAHWDTLGKPAPKADLNGWPFVQATEHRLIADPAKLKNRNLAPLLAKSVYTLCNLFGAVKADDIFDAAGNKMTDIVRESTSENDIKSLPNVYFLGESKADVNLLDMMNFEPKETGHVHFSVGSQIRLVTNTGKIITFKVKETLQRYDPVKHAIDAEITPYQPATTTELIARGDAEEMVVIPCAVGALAGEDPTYLACFPLVLIRNSYHMNSFYSPLHRRWLVCDHDTTW